LLQLLQKLFAAMVAPCTREPASLKLLLYFVSQQHCNCCEILFINFPLLIPSILQEREELKPSGHFQVAPRHDFEKNTRA